MSACARLHALLERDSVCPPCERREPVQLAMDRVQSLAALLFPDKSLPRVLVESRAAGMFPTLRAALCEPAGALPSRFFPPREPGRLDDAPSNRALAVRALVDMTRAMISQLRQELLANEHKYAAHQLALIYQALKAGKLLKPAQAEIESRFDACNPHAVADGERPRLPDEHARWLLALLGSMESDLSTATSDAVLAAEAPVLSCVEALRLLSLASAHMSTER